MPSQKWPAGNKGAAKAAKQSPKREAVPAQSLGKEKKASVQKQIAISCPSPQKRCKDLKEGELFGVLDIGCKASSMLGKWFTTEPLLQAP